MLRAFKYFDKDGDGSITRDELKEALAVSPSRCHARTQAGVVCAASQVSLVYVAQRSNVRMSHSRLPSSLPAQSTGSVDAEIDSILDEVDKNGDGVVDYSEFVALLTKMNEVSTLRLCSSRTRQG